MQKSYNTGRQANPNNPYGAQPSYPGDIQQSQRASSEYNWPGQGRQNYANERQQMYNGGDVWRAQNTHTPTYGDARQTSQYGSQPTDARGGQAYFPSASSNSAGLATQGLNSLAYASGMDGSARQRTGDHAQQQSFSSSTAKYSTSSAGAINRVLSPTINNASARDTYSHSSNSAYHQNEHLPTTHQQQPMSAVANALAGAVTRRYQQPSTSPGQATVSPNLNGASSSQVSVPQRVDSPYNQTTMGYSQRRPSSALGQTSRAEVNNTMRTANPQRPQNERAGQHVRAPSQSARQMPDHRRQEQQAQQVNNISNLVSHPIENVSQGVYSHTPETSDTPLSYIDPTKVFDPFQRERERRAREAEVQGKRRAEEEAAAAQRKEEEEKAAARKQKEEEARVAAKKREEEAAAAAAAEAIKRQPRRKPVAVTSPVTTSTNMTSPQSDHPQPGESSQADMANELKAMMEKMKEFRSKDPSLFQRLWEDLRKPTGSMQSSSPQMSQQASIPAPPSVPLTTTSTSQQQTFHTPIPPPVPASTPKSRKQDGARPEGSAGKHNNGYRVVVENNPEGLPDRGRFPAERRIRGSYSGSTTNTTKSAPQDTGDAAISATGAGAVPNPNFTALPQQPYTQDNKVGPAQASARIRSPLISEGLPPNEPGRGTIWPEEKRTALAEAAVKALKAVPENSQIEIQPADVDAMLQQNPGYIDLCLMLEAKGLRFHRGQFARQLLSKVSFQKGPLAKSPQSQSPPLQGQSGPSQAPVVSPAMGPAQGHGMAATAAPSHHGPMNLAASGPQGLPACPVGQNYRPASIPSLFRTVNGPQPTFKPEHSTFRPQFYQLPKPSKAQASQPTRAEPPPGSKEAMARKRDFSELVDLTGLSDNEDYVLSRKQARVSSPSPERDPFRDYQEQTASIFTPAPRVETHAFVSTLPDNMPLKFDPARPAHAPQIPPLPMVGPPPISSTVKPMRTLAKPINKDAALRRNYYNPKTVARDILLAMGRHPIERPLNAHMAGLLGKHVHLDSDLSTFDWDAIDPGGPAPPQVPIVEMLDGPPRREVGQAAGTEPHVTGLPVKHASDQRIRLPDSDKRGQPAPAPQVSRLQSEQRRPSSEHRNSDTRTATVRNTANPHAQTVPNVSSQIVHNGTETLRSRQRSTRSSSTHLGPAQEAAGRMDRGSTAGSGVKRRGRPPGAKNIIRPSLGKPKKTTNALISIDLPPPPPPSLPAFKCRWKGCKAHLHNLQTLRQHVSKVHQPSTEDVEEYGHICWWRKCQFLAVDEEGSVYPVKSFPTREDWLQHIEEDHLYAVAMKYGDGPSTKNIGKPKSSCPSSSPSSFDVSRFRYSPSYQQMSLGARTVSYLDPQTILQDRARYLSDDNERIATPTFSERIQDDLEPDTMTLIKANHDAHEAQAQRSFMKTHRPEKKSAKALAEETLRAMTERKASVGPGIDRGGCILVTEARRSTLIQNQGLARVVDADY